MPTALPYLNSYKNVEKLFSNISSAKVPDAFTHAFLGDSLGLKGTGDRPLIALLRNLGFLDGSNKPTSSYQQLKNNLHKKSAIAEGVRIAYKPLFDANEDISKLSSEELKGLVSQVSGADEGVVSKTVGTLNALIKLADFSKTNDEPKKLLVEEDSQEDVVVKKKKALENSGLNPEFHFNIQVHLPSNSSEETYLNIFNAIRKVFS